MAHPCGSSRHSCELSQLLLYPIHRAIWNTRFILIIMNVSSWVVNENMFYLLINPASWSTFPVLFVCFNRCGFVGTHSELTYRYRTYTVHCVQLTSLPAKSTREILPFTTKPEMESFKGKSVRIAGTSMKMSVRQCDLLDRLFKSWPPVWRFRIAFSMSITLQKAVRSIQSGIFLIWY